MEETLEDQIRRMGLPSFSALEKADSLAKDLMFHLPEIDEEKKPMAYLFPSDYLIDGITDYRRYKILVDLSSILIATKDIYRQSGIGFNEGFFIDDDELAGNLPELEVLELKDSGLDKNIKELCLKLGIRCLEALEDQFYYFHNFDSRNTNAKQKRYIKQRLDILRSYAEIGVKVADVLDGFNINGSGELRKIMKDMQKKKKLFNDILREDHYVEDFNPIIDLHARFFHLAYDGNPFSFADMFGPEISCAMQIKRDLDETYTFATDLELSGKRSCASSFGGYIYPITKVKEVSERWNKDRVETLGLIFSVDDRCILPLTFVKSPFMGLEERIHSLGMPSRAASFIADFISYSMLNRQPSKSDVKLTRDEILKEIHSKGKHFAPALSRFIEGLVGKKPHDFAYRFFEKKEGTSLADAIDAVAYVARRDKDGIDSISEEWSRLGEEAGMADIKAQHEIRGQDIYLRENSGVCFILGNDIAGLVKMPDVSIIETRDTFHYVKKKDMLAYKILNRHVDFHECIHATQVGSRIIWRSLAGNAAQFYLDMAIKQHKIGRLDSICLHQKLSRIVLGGKNWKETILNNMDLYNAIALGTGEIAEGIREEGIYNKISGTNIEVNSDGSIEWEKIQKNFPFEKSQTASLVMKARDSILEGDIDKMEAVYDEVKKHVYELTGLVETSAEAFSMASLREYLDNLPDNRYSEESKENYFNSMLLEIQRRGIQSQRFLDITSRYPQKEWNQHLSAYGMKYKQSIQSEKDEVSVGNILRKLGYDPIHPYVAYEDMPELESRLKKTRFKLEDALMPQNFANSILGERYDRHIGLVMELISRYGTRRAYNLMENVESFAQVRSLVEDPELKRIKKK